MSFARAAASIALLVIGAGPIQVVKIPSWGNGAPGLVLDAPVGFTLESTKGPDFDVHRLVQAQSKGTGSNGLGIYVGGFPHSSWPADAKTSIATIAGRPVTWHVWTNPDGLHAETLVDGVFKQVPPRGSGVDDLRLHIFIQALDTEAMASLQRAAESLRLAPEKR